MIIGNRIRAIGAKIDGPLELDYCTVDFVLAFFRCAFTGKITFEKARVQGVELIGTYAKSIYAAGMDVSGSVHLWQGFVAEGQLFFDGARISGDLRCDSSFLTYHKWPDDIQFNEDAREAFRGAGLEVKGFISFINGRILGGICLYEASIGGGMRFEGTLLNHEGNVALLCTGAKVGGAVFLDREFIAQGSVDLAFTDIGGELLCENGRITHRQASPDKDSQAPALMLEKARIFGRVCLTNGFIVEGKVSLQGAEIGGQLDCQGGRFLNPGGYAILGNSARIGSGVLLRNGFHADGEVRFFLATVGGNFECQDGNFLNASGVALDAERLHVAGNFFVGLPLGESEGLPLQHRASINGRLSFEGMSVGGKFVLNVAEPEKISLLNLKFSNVTTFEHLKSSLPGPGRLLLNGLVYESVVSPSPEDSEECIKWLRLQPKERQGQKHSFGLQPYEQLAGVLKASGYESEAIKVRIAKQDDLLRYGNLPLWLRFWKNASRHIIGYGYQPHRALRCMLFLVLLGAAFFHVGYRSHLITPTRQPIGVAAKANYPKFQAFVYSLDCFLPVIDLRQKGYWLPNANRGADVFPDRSLRIKWGGLLRAYLWVHILCGWALTTLWVAGFTGLVRRLN